ncbi:MAG: caspase family protein, partial [Myxococcota bacterium]
MGCASKSGTGAVASTGADSSPSTVVDRSIQSQGRRLALLVGIDAYPQDSSRSWSALEGSKNDVEAMQSWLETQSFEVETLTDAAATADGIAEAFRRHLGQAGKDDLALFYFAGHGVQLPDDGVDERDGLDEVLATAGSQGPCDRERVLRDDRLGALVDELASEQVVVIVDACYSGTVTRSGLQLRGGLACDERPAVRDETEVFEARKPRARHVAISAARANEPAVELEIDEGEPRKQGAFTWHLVQELQRAEPTVTWEQIVARVRGQMAANPDLSQQPQIEGAVDLRVFGGLQDDAAYGFFSASTADGGVRIDGGLWEGLRRGDQLTITSAGEPVGRVEVDRVRLDEATAGWTKGRQPARLPSGALEARLDVPRLTVYQQQLFAAGALARRLASTGAEVSTTSKDRGQIVVRERNGRISLEQNGGPIPIPVGCGEPPVASIDASMDDASLARLVVRARQLHESRVRLAQLTNHSVNAVDLEVFVERVDASYDPELGRPV